MTSQRKLVNSLKTHSYGSDLLDLSLKPIAIAAIYQREFVISLKTHQYYNKCSDNLLKPTTIAQNHKGSLKTHDSNINLAARVYFFFKTHTNSSTDKETLKKPTRFNSSKTDFLLKPTSFFSKHTKEKSSDGRNSRWKCCQPWHQR